MLGSSVPNSGICFRIPSSRSSSTFRISSEFWLLDKLSWVSADVWITIGLTFPETESPVRLECSMAQYRIRELLSRTNVICFWLGGRLSGDSKSKLMAYLELYFTFSMFSINWRPFSKPKRKSEHAQTQQGNSLLPLVLLSPEFEIKSLIFSSCNNSGTGIVEITMSNVSDEEGELLTLNRDVPLSSTTLTDMASISNFCSQVAFKSRNFYIDCKFEGSNSQTLLKKYRTMDPVPSLHA